MLRCAMNTRELSVIQNEEAHNDSIARKKGRAEATKTGLYAMMEVMRDIRARRHEIESSFETLQDILNMLRRHGIVVSS